MKNKSNIAVFNALKILQFNNMSKHILKKKNRFKTILQLPIEESGEKRWQATFVKIEILTVLVTDL